MKIKMAEEDITDTHSTVYKIYINDSLVFSIIDHKYTSYTNRENIQSLPEILLGVYQLGQNNPKKEATIIRQ